MEIEEYVFDDDRLALQDEFERLILGIEQMPKSERYEQVLSLLDDHWTNNAERDRDGWLRRSVLLSRAVYLEEMGRFDEAVRACEELARFGLVTRYEVMDLARVWAICLESLGRDEEALDVLERGLGAVLERVPQPALTLLYVMSRACEALGRPMPERHVPIFLASIAKQDIEVDDDPAAHPEHFGRAVVAAFEARRRRASLEPRT